MKRIFSTLLAAAMVLTLAPTVAMAAIDVEFGHVYLPDEDNLYIDDQGDIDGADLVPGTTYYVFLGTKKEESKVSVDDLECEREDEDKKISGIMSKSLKVVQKKIATSGTKYGYFAEMKIKSIAVGSFDDCTEFYVTGVLDTGDFGSELDINITLAYPDIDGELSDELRLLDIEDEDEYDIDFPDGDGYVSVNSNGVTTKVLLSMDTSYNSDIGDKYTDADLDFYFGNGAEFRKRSTVFIEGDEDEYLYEYKNGSLTDLTKRYDDDEGGFVISTSYLGKYIKSDTKLSAAAASSTQSSSAASSSSSSSQSSGGSKGTLSAIISANFSNNFRVIAYGSNYAQIGSTVTLRARGLDMTGLNTGTLRVYAYDEVNNKLYLLTNAGAYVGSDGNFYFKTAVKGQYVITDSALTR